MWNIGEIANLFHMRRSIDFSMIFPACWWWRSTSLFCTSVIIYPLSRFSHLLQSWRSVYIPRITKSFKTDFCISETWGSTILILKYTGSSRGALNVLKKVAWTYGHGNTVFYAWERRRSHDNVLIRPIYRNTRRRSIRILAPQIMVMWRLIQHPLASLSLSPCLLIIRLIIGLPSSIALLLKKESEKSTYLGKHSETVLTFLEKGHDFMNKTSDRLGRHKFSIGEGDNVIRMSDDTVECVSKYYFMQMRRWKLFGISVHAWNSATPRV